MRTHVLGEGTMKKSTKEAVLTELDQAMTNARHGLTEPAERACDNAILLMSGIKPTGGLTLREVNEVWDTFLKQAWFASLSTAAIYIKSYQEARERLEAQPQPFDTSNELAVGDHPALKTVAWVHLCKLNLVEQALSTTSRLRWERRIFVEGYQAALSVLRAKAERHSTWFGYECYGSCSKEGDGCVLDVRLPLSVEATPPHAVCPGCEKPMTFKGCWPAREGGYGSRGEV